MLRGFLPDGAHRLALDFAPAAEVWQRFLRNRDAAAATARRGRHDAFHVGFDVVGGNATAVLAARDLIDVDAKLTSETPYRRRRRGDGCVWRRRLPRRRTRAAADVHHLAI